MLRRGLSLGNLARHSAFDEIYAIQDTDKSELAGWELADNAIKAILASFKMANDLYYAYGELGEKDINSLKYSLDLSKGPFKDNIVDGEGVNEIKEKYLKAINDSYERLPCIFSEDNFQSYVDEIDNNFEEYFAQKVSVCAEGGLIRDELRPERGSHRGEIPSLQALFCESVVLSYARDADIFVKSTNNVEEYKNLFTHLLGGKITQNSEELIRLASLAYGIRKSKLTELEPNPQHMVEEASQVATREISINS